MDDFLDKELKQRLARDPFPGGGFDERLRRKIEERIDGRSRSRGVARRSSAWRWPAAALVSVSVLLLTVWLWGNQHEGSGLSAESLATKPHNMPKQEQTVLALADAAEEKKFALLLGLRKDTESLAGFPISEYRTLLIAADQKPDNLRVMAELPNLYMPYGQHFWKIATLILPEGRQALLAIQATGVASASIPENTEVSDSLLSERIAFAGNAYLSVHTFYKDEKGITSEMRRVKHIQQLNEKADHPANDPYTSPAVFMPEMDDGFEDWIVYRNPGAWVAELYDPGSGEPQKLSAMPKAVVQHDRLNLSWEEIQAAEPVARDAFTYGNLLGIVTDREIQVYALKGRTPMADPVRIPLEKGEQVVMIQWAQNDNIDYVEKWTQDLRSLAGDN